MPGSRGRCAAWVLAALLLPACQAQYDLAEVEAEAAKPIRRTDDIQALAATADEIVGVGGHGVVIHSTDGGESFRRVDLPGWPDLIDVADCPDGSFAALDFRGQILTRARDPESTWSAAALPGPDVGLALTCDPMGRIWVVGEFTSIRSTADGGATWTETTFDRDAIFTDVAFIDEEAAVIAGEFGSFLASEDGGASWAWREPVDEEFYPQALVFRSRSEGWLVGLSGTVFYTADQGVTWTREHTELRSPLFAVTLHRGRPIAVGGLGSVIYGGRPHIGGGLPSVLQRGGAWSVETLAPQVFGVLTSVVSIGPEKLLVAGANGQVRTLALAHVAADASEGRRGAH